jgi:hypothetical protein
MPALKQFMSRGFASPQVHGVRDSPLAAIPVAAQLCFSDHTLAPLF